MLGHGLAQGGHHVAAHDDVLLHLGVAQVKVAVLQAQRLVRLLGAVDLEGQLVVAAAAQHLDLLWHHLNVAGGHLGVLGVALAHGAGHGDDALLVQAMDDLHHVLALHDDLRGAVEVAQHHEGQGGGYLADIFHPAGKLDGFAAVAHAQLVAGMGTVLHRGSSFRIGCFISGEFWCSIPHRPHDGCTRRSSA